MVLTVSFALSPVIGLVCHRRLRRCLRRLDAGVEASGPHDFAVRKPALSSAAPSASTASRPASVTIAIRPSMGRDSGGFRSDLGRHETRLFLRRGLDRQPKSAGAGNQLARAPSTCPTLSQFQAALKKCTIIVVRKFRCRRISQRTSLKLITEPHIPQPVCVLPIKGKRRRYDL